MSRKYKFHNKAGLYFVSFATVYWLDIFTRQIYYNVLANSVNYCRSQKGMQLYAYCFMPNHVHMIIRSSNEQPMELLRDFKKFTSKKIIETIIHNSQESRREWFLWMMARAGSCRDTPQLICKTVTHKLKKSVIRLKIRLTNDTSQTAHLFFFNAKANT